MLARPGCRGCCCGCDLHRGRQRLTPRGLDSFVCVCPADRHTQCPASGTGHTAASRPNIGPCASGSFGMPGVRVAVGSREGGRTMLLLSWRLSTERPSSSPPTTHRRPRCAVLWSRRSRQWRRRQKSRGTPNARSWSRCYGGHRSGPCVPGR